MNKEDFAKRFPPTKPFKAPPPMPGAQNIDERIENADWIKHVKKKNSARRVAIAVIGDGECGPELERVAEDVGRLIAERGAILVTGGRTGVMEAASRGAAKAGGFVVGILPDSNTEAANRWVHFALPTGMGQLRNGLVAASAQAVIAVGGEWGTLSEIGFAAKLGKPVIGLSTWTLSHAGEPSATPVKAQSASEAVDIAFSAVGTR